MKKLKLLIISVMLVLIPIVSINTVKADMASPIVTEYKARVKNPSGTTLYDFDYNNGKVSIKEIKHLDFDTIIKDVETEETINNELYGYSPSLGGYIKLTDIEAFGNIDLDTFNNFGSGKLYVFREGAYLYKGPSKTYGKVDGNVMLPVGTVVEYEYSDVLFAYVTYNGVSGWVYYYQRSMGPYEEGSSLASIESTELITIEDTILYNDPFTKTKKIFTIPNGTKLTSKYEYIYDRATYYYVEYNGNAGWIVNDIGLLRENAKIFNRSTPIKICKNRVNEEETTCSDVITTIPKNKITSVKYVTENGYNTWFFVNYDGKTGWVFDNEGIGTSNCISEAIDGSELFNLLKDTYLYDDIFGNITTKVVKAGSVEYDFMEFENADDENSDKWIHIVDKGWIKVNTSSSEPIEPETPENPTTNPTTPEEPEKPNSKTILIKDLINYCVVGACILSLTTFVVIKLVNKNKETKTEETKE